MRLSFILLACATLGVGTSSLAYQFPTPEDPRARAVIERVGMDTARLDALLAFPKPAAQAWPCEAPIAYLYQPAGVMDAVPPEQIPAEVKAQLEEGKRMMRKTFRGNGMDPSAALVTTSSDIELIPIKAQCKNGKLDGAIEYYIGFRQVMESNMETFSTLTNKLEKNRSVLTSTAQMHITQSYQDGKPTPGIRSARRGTLTNSSIFENPSIQKHHDEMLSKTGMLNRATPQKSVTFGNDQAVATFSLSEEPKVTGGVFGINTEWKTKLLSMIMLITPPVNVSYMYSDNQPLSVMRQNKETGNSESTTYMENFLKKMGKKPGDTPGTDHYREMVVGGRDVLEMRTCIVDFKPAKMDPCPVE
jgi:hypothetical protein